MKSIIKLLAVFLVVQALPAYAEGLTMGEAINIAGRQRMLSQRIAQSYFLIGIQPGSVRGAKQLQRCVGEYERNLSSLKQFKPAKKLREQLTAIEKLWRPYKALATGEVSVASGKRLLQQSNKILAAAHQYVGDLQQLANHKSAELINISGRQRMLSQRIAKNYLANYWGVNEEQSLELLYADLAEYEHMLSYLQQSSVNTPQINTKLRKVSGHFAYASKGFDGVMSLSGDRLIYVVTGTTDAMLRNMNEVTKMYSKLLN